MNDDVKMIFENYCKILKEDFDRRRFEELNDEISDQHGTHMVPLEAAYQIIIGQRWDGLDHSKFPEIIETFKELGNTIVVIDVNKGQVLYRGQVEN